MFIVTICFHGLYLAIIYVRLVVFMLAIVYFGFYFGILAHIIHFGFKMIVNGYVKVDPNSWIIFI